MIERGRAIAAIVRILKLANAGQLRVIYQFCLHYVS